MHRECLDEWRAQEQVARAFTHCPTCKFEYEVEVRDDHRASRLLKFRCLMLRDTCALFTSIQLTLASLAFLLHCVDGEARIPELFPHGWARREAKVHFSIGPYYCSAVIVCLALLGLLGVFLKATGRLPAPPPRPAARHRVDTSCCPNCCQNCVYDPVGCYYVGFDCDACCRACWCCPSEAASCECGACAESCGACDVASAGGEGCALLLPVLLVVLLIFAVIGLFVGAFFSMVLFQRALQRHVHLLQMRSEAQRVVVVNRAWSELGAIAPSMDAGGRAPCAHCSTMHRGGAGSMAVDGGSSGEQHYCPGLARAV